MNRGKGLSEIVGKAVRVAAKERGQRLSFKAGTRHLPGDSPARQFTDCDWRDAKTKQPSPSELGCLLIVVFGCRLAPKFFGVSPETVSIIHAAHSAWRHQIGRASCRERDAVSEVGGGL